jgi:8-oxo-dGTP pyrophosphatase MutT (NUDIX family)
MNGRNMQLQVAQKAVLCDRGHILMIQKSAADPYNPLRWEIPGGRLELGEDLADHLKREVKEEVGLDVEIGPPLAMWKWSMGYGEAAESVVAVSRLCFAKSDGISLADNDATDYLRDWRWVPIGEVADLDLIPTAREGILESLEVLEKYTGHDSANLGLDAEVRLEPPAAHV